MPITRRKFLRNTLGVAAGAALPLAAYSQFIEPHHLTVGRLQLEIPNLPDSFDGFRIAQLSDFHYGAYTRDGDIRGAVELANSLRPDLVVLTGDFITSPTTEYVPSITDPVYGELAECGRLLTPLKAPHGVWSCAGNHDAWIGVDRVAAILSDLGIPLLRNENRPIEKDGKRIWIASIDDALFGRVDLDRSTARIPANEPILLLAHEPDVADQAARHGISVQLSGHSHGGQIRFPLLGALYLPPLARKYPFGYYRIAGMHLYTNRGIGTIALPYRFNAPPEVTLITLRCAKQGKTGAS